MSHISSGLSVIPPSIHCTSKVTLSLGNVLVIRNVMFKFAVKSLTVPSVCGAHESPSRRAGHTGGCWIQVCAH